MGLFNFSYLPITSLKFCQPLLSSFIPLAHSPTNYLSLKYTQNRLPLVSITDLGFYDLPACKYATKFYRLYPPST